MRRSLIILLSIAALLTSCRRVEEPVDGVMVSVQSEFDNLQSLPSKATSTAFEAGDQVGLFMVDFAGGVSAPLQTTGNQADNVCFTSNSSGLLTTNPPVLYTKDLEGKTDIYAYYPYDAQMATKNVNSYEFKVQQSQLGGVSASDLCMAKAPGGVTPSSTPVRLEFNHKLSKIELTLNVPRIYKDNLKIKGVRNFTFMGVVNGVTVNMGAQTVTNIDASHYTELVPFTAQQGVVTDTDNVPFIYHMIAPAQEYAAGRLFISLLVDFEVGGERRFEYVVQDKLFGDNATDAGSIHRLDFSLESDMALVFKGSTIIPWTEAPASNGGLDAVISTEFSVAKQPFVPNFTTANRVKVTLDDGTEYDILSGVSVTNGVCKFKFTKASGFPKQYGFKIVGLEFLNGNTLLYKTAVISDNVYNAKVMNLGVLPFNGEGTEASPYLIRNAAELNCIAQTVLLNGKYFKQMADIDIAPYLAIKVVAGSVTGDGSGLTFELNANRVWPYLGLDDGWRSLPLFENYYDGGGYSIKGISIDRNDVSDQGLFRNVGSKGMVYHVNLRGVYIRGNDNVGGIAANSEGAIFAVNVVDGVLSGNGAVGGVVGRSYKSVNNATNGATVLGRGGDYTGGVIGLANGIGYGSLVNYGTVSGAVYTGGVVGMGSDLKYSYNRGNVSGAAAGTSGAIVGGSKGVNPIFDNCYWLSSASYTNCGANGYGTSITSGVTNFAAMSAATMQSGNKLEPTTLFYKLNGGGTDWVMAIDGYYNVGWLIPNPINYIFAYPYYGIVSSAGGNVLVEVVVSGGESWNATSSNTSIATVASGSSGVGIATVTLAFKDNSASTGGGYRTVDLIIRTSFGQYKLTLRQSNGN